MAVSLSDYTLYKRLVAAGNDSIYVEGTGVSAGDMTQLAASDGDIDTTDQLVMFEAFQKVCIVNGTNKKIADFLNTKLVYNAALTTSPRKGDTLTQATSGASMVVDFVSSDKTTVYGFRTTTATFTATYAITSDDAYGDTMNPASWTPDSVVDRTSGPHWYSWTKHPSTTTAMPTTAYLGCLYRGRAVLSGNPDDPFQWYMSRQGDIFDWTYTANDAQSPIAGQNGDAGKIGDIIRTLIPYHDDYLLYGCSNTISFQQGDPADGGTLNLLTENTGTYGAQSFCWDDKSNLWLFGSSGISVLQNTGPGLTRPENVSNDYLPKLLEDLGADPSTHRITLGFDKKRGGIVIAVTTMATGANQNYWYDLKTKGFFSETYPNACGVYSQFYYNSNDPDYADLLLGCKDGYIRKFDDDSKDDNIGATTQAISSYVLMPIIPAGKDPDHEGKLISTTFVTSGGDSSGTFDDSDSITYDMYSGDSPEQVTEAVRDGDTAQVTGTITGPGRQNRIRDRIRGAFIGIKLSNSTASSSWSLEKLIAFIKAVGRIK